MSNLNECRDLMRRICNLPDNDKDLKKKGFNDDQIKDYRYVISLIDPEANEKVRRIKEIMDYIENKH